MKQFFVQLDDTGKLGQLGYDVFLICLYVTIAIWVICIAIGYIHAVREKLSDVSCGKNKPFDFYIIKEYEEYGEGEVNKVLNFLMTLSLLLCFFIPFSISIFYTFGISLIFVGLIGLTLIQLLSVRFCLAFRLIYILPPFVFIPLIIRVACRKRIKEVAEKEQERKRAEEERKRAEEEEYLQRRERERAGICPSCGSTDFARSRSSGEFSNFGSTSVYNKKCIACGKLFDYNIDASEQAAYAENERRRRSSEEEAIAEHYRKWEEKNRQRLLDQIRSEERNHKY